MTATEPPPLGERVVAPVLCNPVFISAPMPLDGHCALLPYDEALRRIEAESDPDPEDTRFAWPAPNADKRLPTDRRRPRRLSRPRRRWSS